MSRHPPHILMERVSPNGKITHQILEAKNLYLVYYRGQPFSYKRISQNSLGPKYYRTSFPTRGQALNLAEKLNGYFQCSDFAVYTARVRPGEPGPD